MSHNLSLRGLAALLAFSLSGCDGMNGGGSTVANEPPGDPFSSNGTIQVQVAVSGTSPVSEYTVSVSNGQKATVPPNGTVTFATRRTGTHEVAVTPVPATCILTGENPVVVNIHAGEGVQVGFLFTCANQQ